MKSSMDVNVLLQGALPDHAVAIAAFARSPRTLVRFETLNDYGIPPVADLFRHMRTIAPAVALDGRTNQVLGRLAAAVLATHGFAPVRTARIPPAPGITAKTGALFARSSL